MARNPGVEGKQLFVVTATGVLSVRAATTKECPASKRFWRDHAKRIGDISIVSDLDAVSFGVIFSLSEEDNPEIDLG